MPRPRIEGHEARTLALPSAHVAALNGLSGSGYAFHVRRAIVWYLRGRGVKVDDARELERGRPRGSGIVAPPIGMRLRTAAQTLALTPLEVMALNAGRPP